MLTTERLRELALQGIAAQRAALDAIEAELRAESPTRRTAPKPNRHPRSKMSAAQRKAVSERMKAYWAKRRK